MKKIYITLFLLYSSLLATAQTIPFQDTKGSLEISNSGQANYTIPIALPPSLKNVAPKIDLVYSSGARGGIAGQGWNISSISSISRMATRYDIDGFRDGVDFDDNDKLALDGQRLLIKTGNYWENGSTYQTEYKSNTKIELKMESTHTYFVVTSPDGSQTWYGSTGNGVFQNATSPNAWFIVRFMDTYGNYITYNYTTVTYAGVSNQYIDNIQFSGNEPNGLPLLNKIQFNYANAARVEKDFIKGQTFYASKILNNVQVFTKDSNNSDVLFRRYQLTHITDDDGYQRVQQVQEYNGMNEASNPVVFSYATTSSNVLGGNIDYYNGFFSTPASLTGDFDGDGNFDFVKGNQVYTKINGIVAGQIVTIPYGPRFAINTIKDNKKNQFQSFLYIDKLNDLNTRFTVTDLSGSLVNNAFIKTINLDLTKHNTINNNTGSTYGIQCLNYLQTIIGSFGGTIDATYNEADFDGDGISEILIKKPITDCIVTNNPVYNVDPSITPPTYCNWTISYPIGSHETYYLLDMNPNKSSVLGSNGYIEVADTYYNDFRGKQILTISDFNGDGNADILAYGNGQYVVLEIKKENSGSYNYGYFNRIGIGTLPYYSTDKQILFGDYNGDGKTDLMIPVCIDCSDWAILYSNPNPNNGSFFYLELQYNILMYHPTQVGQTYRDNTTYYAMDINKDGKTDIVSVYLNEWKNTGYLGLDPNNWDSSWVIKGYTNRIGKSTGSSFVETYNSYLQQSDSPEAPIFIPMNNYKINNTNADFIVINNFDHKIYDYRFIKNFKQDNLLYRITESNGNIVQDITNSPLRANNGDLGSNPFVDYYSSTNSVIYPNIEIIKDKNMYVVTEIKASINGVNKFQIFKYHGLVYNFDIGVIGFKRTARTMWKVSSNLSVNSDLWNSDIWTIQENDSDKKGANTKIWTNTDVMTLFATTPNNLLSSKINTFDTYTNPTSKVYNVLLTQQATSDILTNTATTTNYTYDGNVTSPNYFGLQTQVNTTTSLNGVLQGMSNSTTTYDNNESGTGFSYFIGRPSGTTTSTTIYPNDPTKIDTRTSSVAYTYNNGNLTQTSKNGHNTPNAIVETMTYDPMGNLLTKTVSCPTATSPALTPRTITDQYDPTKRFVIKKIDHQGFETNFQYNPLGQVTKTTNYLGVMTDTGYDNWGKPTQTTTTGAATNVLTSTTTYTKLTNGGYTTTSTNNVDGATNTTQYDVLGRAVRTTSRGFAVGTSISKTIEYDALGRKYRESEPFATTASKWTTYNTYDIFNRPTQVTAPTGRVQTLVYLGLTTKSWDDGKLTTATLDALGNKVQTTDPGGAINFKFYANGQLKESDYDGHKITIDIDGWGKKIAMTDPNAGTYTYAYDEFDQIKTETTPKGATNYLYDSLGKLTQKTIVGDGADYKTVYSYNTFAHLIGEVSTKNSTNAAVDNYVYRYDTLHRLDQTTETNANFTHSKTIGFDNYSRVLTETNATTDTASGFSSSVVAKSNYNSYNGIMDKLTDSSNATLWQLNTANERMQALTATLGNGIVITNTYDTNGNGYFASQRHQKNTIDVLYNTYSFNAVKGTLTNRQNVVLGTNEVFTYDNLDRLTSWTNPITNTLASQSYDTRGRIDTNNLGTYNYTNSTTAGMYRKTSVSLSTEGSAYYTAKPLQTATYTMFKSPLTINESSLGGCKFEYNSHLSRTRMYYGYSNGSVVAPAAAGVRLASSTTATAAAAAAPTETYSKYKLYTDDGSTEIIKANGKIRIITYIGGTAYSAPLYNEKTKTISNSAVTTNNYYLHRDYLGSIIAISNSAGVAVERRHFDAWGNLSKLQQNGVMVATPATNTGLVGLMMIDRGYTSHEHLAEVGLIQMNGRLYDPVLRTFLMPDNFVQQPENTQNYNRYAYVLNNPLMYTDPSGEFIPLLAAVAIGIFVSGVTYYATCLRSGMSFSWGGLAQATFIGAASAAVTFGIGSAASSMFAQPALGFLQGAAQGAAIGAISGAGGVVANAIFSGQNITLKAVLGGAILGGAIGAVVGGIQGGINARAQGKSFWSGKDNWQNVKIGNSQAISPALDAEITDNTYDVDRKLNLLKHEQPEGSMVCTYKEKLIADDYYCVTGQDEINSDWLKDVNGPKGLTPNQITPHYENAGYTVNHYTGSMDSQGALPWIAEEMRNGRIVQFNIGNLTGHNVSVTRVAYMFSFKDNIIQLNNYVRMRGISSAVKEIFSVWHP